MGVTLINVKIGKVSNIKTKKGLPGIIFNAYIQLDNEAFLIQGLQIYAGKLYPPAYRGKGRFGWTSAMLVTENIAKEVYNELTKLLDDGTLLTIGEATEGLLWSQAELSRALELGVQEDK